MAETLIIEDGTGKADAQAYVNLTYVNQYFTDRQSSAWTGSDEVKEAAILKATAFLDGNYKYRGTILKSSQALRFPRTSIKDELDNDITGVPEAIKKASAELAVRALTINLAPDSVPTEGRPVTMVSKAVGSIKKTVVYAKPSDVLNFPSFPEVFNLIRHLIITTVGIGSPSVSGIDKSEMLTNDNNEDIIQPAFSRDMFNYPDPEDLVE